MKRINNNDYKSLNESIQRMNEQYIPPCRSCGPKQLDEGWWGDFLSIFRSEFNRTPAERLAHNKVWKETRALQKAGQAAKRIALVKTILSNPVTAGGLGLGLGTIGHAQEVKTAADQHAEDIIAGSRHAPSGILHSTVFN